MLNPNIEVPEWQPLVNMHEGPLPLCSSCSSCSIIALLLSPHNSHNVWHRMKNDIAFYSILLQNERIKMVMSRRNHWRVYIFTVVTRIKLHIFTLQWTVGWLISCKIRSTESMWSERKYTNKERERAKLDKKWFWQ